MPTSTSTGVVPADLRLYRFSTRQRILDLAHKGLLYLNPATKFNRDGLSKGALDPNELRFSQTIPTEARATLEAFCGTSGKSKGTLKPTSFGPLMTESDTNYYVFCMTYRYMFEYYAEFNADTCLIIVDPDRFINQACLAIRKILPGWLINAGTVQYRSKQAFHSLYPSYRDIFYHKDADKFGHQYEIRIVCAPPERTLNLEPLVIPISNLYGYTFITGLENPERMIESERSNSLGSPYKPAH